jgi:septum formation protein
MPSELVLASASPRRAGILRGIGIPFRQVASGVDETHHGSEPAEAAREVALRKAVAVAGREPSAVVLGADTVVVAPDGRMLGKPVDETEAVEMLLSLAGRSHTVVTGVAVAGAVPAYTAAETTRVVMRPFGRDEAERYARSGEPLDKAGAYGIQGRGGLLVEGIEGCYWNVVGLPLGLVRTMLGSTEIADDWLGPVAGKARAPEEG